MRSRKERRKIKIPPMRGLDMNLCINIAKQDPRVWRTFSLVDRQFASVFNRTTFAIQFPNVIFSDIVDHNFLKFKDLRIKKCKCGKINKRIPTLYGDSDSLFIPLRYGFMIGTIMDRLEQTDNVVHIPLPSNRPPAPFIDNSRRQTFQNRQPQNYNKRR